jgi:hypothetical protein
MRLACLRTEQGKEQTKPFESVRLLKKILPLRRVRHKGRTRDIRNGIHRLDRHQLILKLLGQGYA